MGALDQAASTLSATSNTNGTSSGQKELVDYLVLAPPLHHNITPTIQGKVTQDRRDGITTISPMHKNKNIGVFRKDGRDSRNLSSQVMTTCLEPPYNTLMTQIHTSIMTPIPVKCTDVWLIWLAIKRQKR